MNPLPLSLMQIVTLPESAIAPLPTPAVPSALTDDFAARLASQLAAAPADAAPPAAQTRLPAPAAPADPTISAAPTAATKPLPRMAMPQAASPAARIRGAAKADDPSAAEARFAETPPTPAPETPAPEAPALPASPDSPERPLPEPPAESPAASAAPPIAVATVAQPPCPAPPAKPLRAPLTERAAPLEAAPIAGRFPSQSPPPLQAIMPKAARAGETPRLTPNPGPNAGPVPFDIPPTPLAIAAPPFADMAASFAPDPAKPPLDLQNDAWVASLSHEIVAAHEKGAPLSFRIAPHFLGELQVGLTETPQGIIIELRPSSAEAAALIAREEPRLVEELRQRGVSVAEANLQFGASSDGRNSRASANFRPFQPLPFSDPIRVQGQNQHRTRPSGRFA